MQRKRLLELARERLGLLPSENLSGNTYSLIMEDGTYIDYKGRVCFQDLRENRHHPIFIVNTVRTEVGKKLSNDFVRWWVGEGFVSKAFITKDEKIILEEGAILNCSYPAHYVVMAMIGLRYLWEFPKIIRNWGMFSEYVNNDSAIIMAHMFTVIDEDTWEDVFRSGNSNHTWFQSYWNKDEFTKAINHDLSALNVLPPMSECTIFSPMIQIFSQGRTVNYGERGNLSYPPSNKMEKIRSSFDSYLRETKVYKKIEMEKWLKETYCLNYLKKEGKKNEG